jgi:hypothetical protein
MLTISLTDFVDFVIKTGPAKLTKVKQVVARGDYDPRFDFWKPLRECIQDFHQGKSTLDSVLPGLTDAKKIGRYPEALKCYKKYVSKKHPKWFKPPSAMWSYGGLEVRVNPELGLEQDGARYAVKLYFKDEKPTKTRLKVVFELMKSSINPTLGLIPAVLDIGSSRLVSASPADPSLKYLLEAEALAFVHMWNSVATHASSAKA